MAFGLGLFVVLNVNATIPKQLINIKKKQMVRLEVKNLTNPRILAGRFVRMINCHDVSAINTRYVSLKQINLAKESYLKVRSEPWVSFHTKNLVKTNMPVK